jgi:hypothetical protein
MARPRSAGPSRPSAIEAQFYRPDLLAKKMIITAANATKKVSASAVVENIGVAAVSGPFKIAVYVDLHRGGVLTSYVQVFTVPASVTLHARPVFTQALAFGPIGNTAIWQTQYATPKMEVPLYYRDVDGSYYDGGFLVDSDHDVSESNEYNNYYTWQGNFWFTSPGAFRKKEPIVVQSPSVS